MDLSQQRNRTGNFGVMGFFGSPGIDNNVHLLSNHDHMTDISFLSYRTTDGTSLRQLRPDFKRDFLSFEKVEVRLFFTSFLSGLSTQTDSLCV